MKPSAFFETLERSVLLGHRESRKTIEDHYKKSRMCFEDYVKSMCGSQNKDEPKSKTVDNEGVISRAQYHTVRNISKAESVDSAVHVMMNSGWDYIDRRRKMNKTVDEVQEFLDQCLRGRSQKLNDFPKPMANLLGMIVDSWLDWHSRLVEQE